MKILSTPTAKTKNGIISNIIKVAETPMKPKIPIEAATDRRTIITPPKPRVICKSLLARFLALVTMMVTKVDHGN